MDVNTIDTKKYFYSNCLFEAIKAKIRNPRTTKITVVPRSEAGKPHFLWSDEKYDYDFGVDHPIPGWHIPCFKGYIRKRNLGFNEKYKNLMKEKYHETSNSWLIKKLFRRRY